MIPLFPGPLFSLCSRSAVRSRWGTHDRPGDYRRGIGISPAFAITAVASEEARNRNRAPPPRAVEPHGEHARQGKHRLHLGRQRADGGDAWRMDTRGYDINATPACTREDFTAVAKFTRRAAALLGFCRVEGNHNAKSPDDGKLRVRFQNRSMKGVALAVRPRGCG
jgi:hypothetical protein